MAEFPELGRNCSLEACKKLDFTPFLCNTCERYFCGEHRLDHGCQFENLGVEPTTSGCHFTKPLRPYLCSMVGCFTSETIKIDCQNCGYNFCLKHRYPEEHQCCAEGLMNRRIGSDHREELKKKLAVIIDVNPKANNPSLSQKEKPMDETMRKRADRIAIMRLKSNTRNFTIPAEEQMFLFVTENQKREPVMVSKRWTIGRCLDQIVRQYSNRKSSITFEAQLLRLYSETDHANPLPMSDNVVKHLKDFSNVFLKKEN